MIQHPTPMKSQPARNVGTSLTAAVTKRTARRVTQAALFTMALLGAAVSASADPPSGPPPKPPQAAFDACSSAKEGDSCTVTFHERTLTGTCSDTPDGLACRPNGPPPGPPPSGS